MADIFKSPEEVLAAEKAQQGVMDLAIAQGQVNPAALAGAQFGRAIGQGIGGLFGVPQQESAELKQAKFRQDLLKGLNPANPNTFVASIQQAYQSGDYPLAIALAEQYKGIQKEAKYTTMKPGEILLKDGQEVYRAPIEQGDQWSAPMQVPGLPDGVYGQQNLKDKKWTIQVSPQKTMTIDLTKREENLRDDYRQDTKYLTEARQAATSVRGLLRSTPSAEQSRALQTKMAELFSTNSRAIAEVESWKNMGPLVTQIAGTVNKLLAGTPTEGQYKAIEKLLNEYENNVLNPMETSLNDYYTGISKHLNIDPKMVIRGTKEIEYPEYDFDNMPIDQLKSVDLGSLTPLQKEQLDKRLTREGF